MTKEEDSTRTLQPQPSVSSPDQAATDSEADSGKICPQDGSVCWDSCDVAFCEAEAQKLVSEPRPIVYVVTCLIKEPPIDLVSIVAAFSDEDAAASCVNRCTMENTRPTRAFFLHQARIDQVGSGNQATQEPAAAMGKSEALNDSINPAPPSATGEP